MKLLRAWLYRQSDTGCLFSGYLYGRFKYFLLNAVFIFVNNQNLPWNYLFYTFCNILNKIIYKLKDLGSFRRFLSKCFDMPQSKSKIIVILIFWKRIINFRHVWKYCEKWLLVCPSVFPPFRMEQFGFLREHLYEAWHLIIFRKSVEKVLLKFSNLGVYTFWKYLGKFLLDWKQLENVGSFKYLGSMLTNDERCTCEIKCGVATEKAAFNKKRAVFTSILDLKLRKKVVKCYIWRWLVFRC